MQKVLVRAHLCDGPIGQHQDLVSLGQDMQRVRHQDPSLGRAGAEVTCAGVSPGQKGGTGAPSYAPAFVLENTISKENNGVSPVGKMWVRVNLWEPLILMVLWGDPRNPR